MASKEMLHILGPTCWNAGTVIVEDHAALEQLRHTVTETLGKVATASVRETFLPTIAPQQDMWSTQTSWADEATPERSQREQIPPHQFPNFSAAFAKAKQQQNLISSVSSFAPIYH